MGLQGEVAVNSSVDVKSYTSLHTLVNDMFPPTTLVEQVSCHSKLLVLFYLHPRHRLELCSTNIPKSLNTYINKKCMGWI
jgi:hypothetical protein